MKKIILAVAVSLDGFIEGPNGEYDWCFTDQDYGMAEFYNRIDSVFLGRKSYELTLSMGDMQMPGVPKFQDYIFSNTLKEVKPGKILISGDIESKVRQIKNNEGKDIWLFGGAKLTRSLLNLGLVDEIWVGVHPIVLGGGKPLFEDISGRVQLKLMNSKVYDTGLVSLIYQVV